MDWTNLTQRSNQSEEELRYNCNECGDTRGRLYINKVSGFYYCFNCAASGRVPDGFRTELGLSGLYTHRPTLSPKTHSPIQLASRLFFSSTVYLRNHNCMPKVCLKWGVRSGIESYLGRVCFPARYRKRLASIPACVSWSAHAVRKGLEPKAYHVIHPHEARMYPMILARDSATGDPLVPILHQDGIYKWNPGVDVHIEGAFLVEGPADAFRILSAMHSEECREWGVVCLWGKHLNETDAYCLGKMFPNFHIWLDNDAPQEASRLRDILRVFTDGGVSTFRWGAKSDVSHIEFWRKYKDPAEFSNIDMQQVFKEVTW